MSWCGPETFDRERTMLINAVRRISPTLGLSRDQVGSA